jgi:outer membrane protein TolC
VLSRYRRSALWRQRASALVVVCAIAVSAIMGTGLLPSACLGAAEVAIDIDSLTYDGLVERILTESSSAIAARQDYELSLMRNANSAKLWDPEVSVSGTLDRYEVKPSDPGGSHAQSVALNLNNQAQILGGTASLEGRSTYSPSPQDSKLRNQLSVSLNRSLTTGGIEARLVELKQELAALQADKAYADQLNDLLITSISGLSAAIKERNDLIISAARLELATFSKTVADEKYARGMISASALATAQDNVRSASKSFFDKLSSYRDKLWELSRNAGLGDITDDQLDAAVSQARLDVSEFLAASALDGAEATAAAQGLLASLRDAVLLPDATVRDVDTLYEKLASESGGEEEISKLPSMRISDLSLEIERLTLEKTERDLGWRVNASVSASWADFRDQSGRDPGLQASVAVTFSKQLLGSSIREAASELEVKQSRLEGESEAKLHTFVRQLSNLEKTVEDREYAYEAAQDSLSESLQLWELTVNNYVAGLATNADVVSAAVSLLQAESALRSSQIDNVLAKMRYMNAMGQSPVGNWMGSE